MWSAAGGGQGSLSYLSICDLVTGTQGSEMIEEVPSAQLPSELRQRGECGAEGDPCRGGPSVRPAAP